MKTILISLLSFFFVLEISTAQQDTLQLCAQVEKNGLEIMLNVYVSNFIEVSTIEFGVAWETEKYEFISIEDINPETANLKQAQVFTNIPDEITLRKVIWFDDTGNTPRTLDDGSLLFSIKLIQLDPNISGIIGIPPNEDYIIEFSDNFSELIPNNIHGLDCLVTPFSLFTDSSETDTLKLCAQLETSGLESTLNVYVDNFEDILGFQFGVAWETDNYDFISMDNINPEIPSIVHTQTFSNIPDEITLHRVLWLDNTTVNPRTLDDGSLLFSINLMQLDPNISGILGITPNQDFAIEFTNSDVEIIDHTIEGPNCLATPFSFYTSSKKLFIQDLTLAPNPFYEDIVISLDDLNTGSFEVYSVYGEFINQYNFKNEKEVVLPLSYLHSGTYLLIQKSENGEILGQSKIIKY